LVRNISREVLTQMVGLSTTTAVWKAMMGMFSVQSQSQIVHLHTKMNQCHKENKTRQVYLDEIKGLSGEMASAGKPMDTMDVISHILARIDDTYDDFVSAINALLEAEKNVTLSDVYAQFMAYESQMEGRLSGDGSSINAPTRGGRIGGRGRGKYQEQYQYRD
jgi:hypothetical protein